MIVVTETERQALAEKKLSELYWMHTVIMSDIYAYEHGLPVQHPQYDYDESWRQYWVIAEEIERRGYDVLPITRHDA